MRFISSLIGMTPRPVKRLLRSNPFVARAASRVAHGLMGGEQALPVGNGLRMWLGGAVPLVYSTDPDLERDVLAAMLSRISPGMTVVDAGAYAGFHALHLARAVTALGTVIAFEPDPANCDQLRRNLALNDLDNVQVHQAALSDREGEARFAARGDSESHVGEGSLYVRTVRLDDAVKSAHLIKMDVEDHEVTVLRGATRLINEVRPVWLIEVHSPQSLAGCRELLGGYKLSTIDGLGDPFTRGHLLAVPH